MLQMTLVCARNRELKCAPPAVRVRQSNCVGLGRSMQVVLSLHQPGPDLLGTSQTISLSSPTCSTFRAIHSKVKSFHAWHIMLAFIADIQLVQAAQAFGQLFHRQATSLASPT
jgi:hypothetical protein